MYTCMLMHASPPTSCPRSVLNDALFHEDILASTPASGGLVLVRDIDFASLSEESLLPFHGRVHIAYVPDKGVVLGLSKLARLARLYAKRVQTQARLTQQVLAALMLQVCFAIWCGV